MAYLAAIDIGSNAIRLAIAHQSPRGLHLSYRSREAVRLGASVFSKGEIDEPTFSDLKQALLRFRNQIENHNVLKYRAIATSAMREARNGREVVRRLFEHTGIHIEVISGQEEARLVSLSISKKINLSRGNHLLIDIGGGSIELVALVDGKMTKKQSFVLGMVRVLELHKEKKKDLAQWLPEHINDQVSDFFEDLPPLKTAVGTGGNMDRFIKLKEFIADPTGMDLSFEQMNQIYDILSNVSYEDRVRQFSLKPDRADVIIPAAIATLKFMLMGQCDSILFPEVGIKDGVLQELSSGSEN